MTGTSVVQCFTVELSLPIFVAVGIICANNVLESNPQSVAYEPKLPTASSPQQENLFRVKM